MAAAEPIGWVTHLDRVWMLAPFKKALDKRQREERLLDRLAGCLKKLFHDPRQPGLNLEAVRRVGRHSVLSARIDQSHRDVDDDPAVN